MGRQWAVGNRGRVLGVCSKEDSTDATHPGLTVCGPELRQRYNLPDTTEPIQGLPCKGGRLDRSNQGVFFPARGRLIESKIDPLSN